MKKLRTYILIILTIFIVIFIAVGILQRFSILPVRCYQFDGGSLCYSIFEVDFWRFYNTDYNKYGWWQM